jgi:hypothetical protein
VGKLEAVTGTKVTGAAPVNMVNGSHRVWVDGQGMRMRAIGSQQEGAGTLHADEMSSFLSRDFVKEASATTDTQTMQPLEPCASRTKVTGAAVVDIGPTATATATELAPARPTEPHPPHVNTATNLIICTVANGTRRDRRSKLEAKRAARERPLRCALVQAPAVVQPPSTGIHHRVRC